MPYVVLAGDPVDAFRVMDSSRVRAMRGLGEWKVPVEIGWREAELEDLHSSWPD